MHYRDITIEGAHAMEIASELNGRNCLLRFANSSNTIEGVNIFRHEDCLTIPPSSSAKE